ncbi:MAG: hypothetical protein AB8F95_05355 [Bacteroidia bacterium]
MRIANPLYDHAFKYLMSNNRLAKKVISTILDQHVISLDLNQQELVRQGSVRGFKVFRLDLKATIQHADGRKEQVMIELQKSKLPTNIHRFRQYLGGIYADNSALSDQLLDEQPAQLPIITIYILGYNIPDLPILATRVERKLVDASTGEEVSYDSTFVRELVHQSHILQIRRLPEKRRSRLEHFLQLFDQSRTTDKNFILELDEIPQDFHDIASYLSEPLNDKAMINDFTVEEEMEMYFRIADAEKARLMKEHAEARAHVETMKTRVIVAEDNLEQILAEKERAEFEKKKAESEKEKAESEKKKAESEKKRAESEKERAEYEKKHLAEAQVGTLKKLATMMLKLDHSDEEILAETGLSPEVLAAIKKA